MASIISTRYGYNVGGAEGRQPVGIILVVSELALDPAILYFVFETCERPVGGGLYPPAKM